VALEKTIEGLFAAPVSEATIGFDVGLRHFRQHLRTDAPSLAHFLNVASIGVPEAAFAAMPDDVSTIGVSWARVNEEPAPQVANQI
jgi:hypothetical protein